MQVTDTTTAPTNDGAFDYYGGYGGVFGTVGDDHFSRQAYAACTPDMSETTSSRRAPTTKASRPRARRLPGRRADSCSPFPHASKREAERAISTRLRYGRILRDHDPSLTGTSSFRPTRIRRASSAMRRSKRRRNGTAPMYRTSGASFRHSRQTSAYATTPKRSITACSRKPSASLTSGHRASE